MKNPTVLSLLTLGVAACGAESPEPAQPVAHNVATITVVAESLPAVMPISGSVEARRRASLSTRMMAQVSSISVEVGDRIRAGQAVIRLGTEDIAVNRAKATAAVGAARAARDEAARHVERMDTLHAQDAVPRVHLDQARLQFAQVESQFAMAEATLQEVESANRYATIRAPFEGAVAARHINEGDLAAPGMPLLEIEATGPREAVFSVPADMAGNVEVGSTITITAGGDLTAYAEVRAVASGADPRTRTVQVRAALPSDWPTGVAVTALVPAGTRTGVAVPERAVVRRGQLTGVRVMTPAGELIRWVRLGRRVTPATTGDATVEQRVEVLSGLEPGERIVL
jgi:RND family efflux transporter MFP subunit